MNIGICGTGTIASWTSDIMNQLDDPSIVLYACATAPGFDCTEFAAKYGWKKVCASYEELMSDPAVDLVYIAVPNTFHYDLCKQALNAGKAVLVEKPFAINDTQAAELIALAEEKGLFLCEALWPSFLPVRKAIDEEITALSREFFHGGHHRQTDGRRYRHAGQCAVPGSGQEPGAGRRQSAGRRALHVGLHDRPLWGGGGVRLR